MVYLNLTALDVVIKIHISPISLIVKGRVINWLTTQILVTGIQTYLVKCTAAVDRLNYFEKGPFEVTWFVLLT